MDKKRMLGFAGRLVVFATLITVSGSVMLGSILGVSASTAARIIAAAYKAYKAGRSIKAAIAAFTGPGALLWLAVDFLLGIGLGKALGSSWAAAA
ncbi:hypothetical protein [Gemella cuniculi]|uniref:hypothetical protein n=1 Tax=Gemella cuniculi TaxID=150240 RepID=UPI000414062F|nr:hypothetical protein [Gemella cuniculi]